MDQLIIKHNEVSQGKKILNLVTGIYLAGFALYFCIVEGIGNRFGVLFFCALAAFVLAAIIVLSYTLWLPGAILNIDTNTIKCHLPKQSKMTIDWTAVSRVNMGLNYIIFMTNGEKKQSRLELSQLIYDDVKTVKSKIVEICEYKNIPYHND